MIECIVIHPSTPPPLPAPFPLTQPVQPILNCPEPSFPYKLPVQPDIKPLEKFGKTPDTWVARDPKVRGKEKRTNKIGGRTAVSVNIEHTTPLN